MRTITALCVVLLLAACGDGPKRPSLVATNPLDGEILPTVRQLLLLEYDEPVSILDQVAIQSWQNGVRYAMFSQVDPGDPRRVITQPIASTPWGVGWVAVQINPGLVVNANLHYTLNVEWVSFGLQSGPPPTKLLVDPPALAELDPESGAVRRTIPTPGDRAAVGLVLQERDRGLRSWVQLADGGGSGEALAVYDGVGGMRPLALSCDRGGDLCCRWPAIALTLDGRSVYAAYRDEAAGGVRLLRVDAHAEVETRTLLLSAPPSADTWPTALSIPPDGSRVDVCWSSCEGLGAATIDADRWVEIPRGP